MFVGAFHNGLKGGHFNVSLTQKLVVSMKKIMAYVECYIKSEERNTEKKARYVKECNLGVSDSS